MSEDLIDGQQRQACRQCERLRGGQPDQQRTDQSRLSHHRDRGQFAEIHICLTQRFVNHWQDAANVCSRGDLRDDAAEPLVQFILAGDDIRQDGEVSPNHRCAGFIAGRLNG